MNLCTDQLAMMLAGPGQLHSVSYIALDPRASAMVEEAQEFRINHGLAEQIYLMRPDLVVAGRFTTQATVSMLRRLEIPVVTFNPAYSLQDVQDRILKMGQVLHREKQAAAMADDFAERLAQLKQDLEKAPSAVIYYANGYTAGDQTLAGQILAAAGFENAGTERGYTRGMVMPLEVLAVTDPDALITSTPYPGASRSEDILAHPVVQTLREVKNTSSITDHDWVCGTPYVLRAIERLSEDRVEMTKAPEAAPE